MIYDFESMVSVMKIWLQKQPEHDKNEFINTPKDNLARYDSTLGRYIRNEFKLWDTEWVPVLEDGVDCSEDHPDQISMRVVQAVWDRLQSS